jgi:hypothetical protein
MASLERSARRRRWIRWAKEFSDLMADDTPLQEQEWIDRQDKRLAALETMMVAYARWQSCDVR